jgi:hypothetical protein
MSTRNIVLRPSAHAAEAGIVALDVLPLISEAVEVTFVDTYCCFAIFELLEHVEEVVFHHADKAAL